MELNYFSKHCVIIGIITALSSILVIVTELINMQYYMHLDEYFFEKILFQKIASITISTLIFMFTALMVQGIFKKRHSFLLPWLAVMCMSSVLSTITAFVITIKASNYHYLAMLVFLIFIGLEIIIIYPIYGLYMEMRKENLADFNGSGKKIAPE